MQQQTIWYILAIVGLFGLSQCKVEPIEPPAEEEETPDYSSSIDSLFQATGKLADPPSNNLEKLNEVSDVPVSSGGSNYFCNQSTFRLSKRLDSFTASAFDVADPNLAALYPGSIVRLKDLEEENNLTSIGSIDRKEVILRSSSLNGATKKVMPEDATAAVAEMESEFTGTVPANFAYEAIEAYSSEQALLELGIKVNWLAGSVANKFSVSETAEERTVMISFVQSYHTVSMDYPGTASEFFGDEVSTDQIGARMSADNPLGYISQVTYGRKIIAKVTYSTSSSLTRNELAAGLTQGMVGLNFSFDSELQQVLTNSSIQLSVLGGGTDIISQLGNGDNAFEVLQNIQKYLEEDAQNLDAGLPIAYTVRYLVDNSLFASGGVVEYEAQNCVIDPQKVSVSRITVEQFPGTDQFGEEWDDWINDYDPDIYWILYQYNETTEGFDIIKSLPVDNRKENASSSDVPFGWSVSPAYSFSDWKNKYFWVNLWDYDSYDDDNNIGGALLYFPDHLPDSGEYPSQITITNDNQTIRITLDLIWE